MVLNNMFKVNHSFDIFIVNFEQISHIVLVFLLLMLNKLMSAGRWLRLISFSFLFSVVFTSKGCSSFLQKSITAKKMRFSTNNFFSKYN